MKLASLVSVSLATWVAARDVPAARADGPLLWHAGLNARAELGTHPVRVDVGLQSGATDLTLVLDPMFWTDGQLDVDLLSDWQFTRSGWGLVSGLRWTSIGVADGRQSQDKVVLGLAAPLAGRNGSPLRVRWTFEVAAVIVKHGAGLPTEWIGFGNARDFIDLINFGMFVSIDYASIF
jgi:hypothetical protein